MTVPVRADISYLRATPEDSGTTFSGLARHRLRRQRFEYRAWRSRWPMTLLAGLLR